MTRRTSSRRNSRRLRANATPVWAGALGTEPEWSGLGEPPVVPVVHMNGTPRGRLKEENDAAYRAVLNALREVEQASPNGRDYYPLGDVYAAKAVREHIGRVDRLRAVLAELAYIGEWIAG